MAERSLMLLLGTVAWCIFVSVSAANILVGLLAQLVALWSDDPGHQERLRDLLRATARDEVQVVG